MNDSKSIPGDIPEPERVKRFIRVDQAGEYGAVRIYKGQLTVMKDGPAKDLVRHMLEQEEVHLNKFNELVSEKRVRPTALQPLWHVAGFALGAATALMGEKAAMACTVAVEDAINEHYSKQRDSLTNDNHELRETIERFRLEEMEHHDSALENGAEEAPFYSLMRRAIKAGSKTAIWLSERV